MLDLGHRVSPTELHENKARKCSSPSCQYLWYAHLDWAEFKPQMDMDTQEHECSHMLVPDECPPH